METTLGRQLGVSEYLQLQELIAHLPDDLPPEQLRDLLLPLFAQNELQQTHLRAVFDQCLLRARDMLAQENDAPPQPAPVVDTPKFPRIRAIVAGLLLIAAVAAYRYCWPEPIPPAPSQYIYKRVSVGENATSCPDRLPFEPDTAVFCQAAAPGTAHAVYAISNNACLGITASDSSGIDTVCATIRRGSAVHNIYWIISVESSNSVNVIDTIKQTQPQLFKLKALPFPDERPLPGITALSGWERLFARYEWLFKTAAIVLIAALLFLFLRWRDRRRRKLIAELESNTRPPYVWNIRIENLEPPEPGEAYFQALQRLRRREHDEQVFLDVPATIQATVENAGFVRFRFGRFTRPPEYLLLIDRQDVANHRARLFDQLYHAFRQADVLVERFFFDGDIRRCSNEQYPGGLTLPELKHRYPEARLLIVSDGYQLLSPVTGKLARWADFLTQWKQRSLLSPVPTDTWGRREEYLGGILNVLPASLQGLNFLIEQLDAGEDADWRLWRERVSDAPAAPVEVQGGLITTLRYYFSEKMVQWIAACAVYPSLHYDLTLYIGQTLSEKDDRLVTVGNVSELTRLPWFVEGAIPRQAREDLLGWLEMEYPRVLLGAREALHSLLAQNKPPENSVAWDEFRMTAALNEWLITKDARQKARLEKEIEQLLEKGVEADFTVIKYLNRKRSPLDFIVPDGWKKYIRDAGHRFGLRDLWRDLSWALPLWLVASAVLLCWPPRQETCRNPQPLDGKQVCLDLPADQLYFYEKMARDSARSGNLPACDSINALARPLLDSLKADSSALRYRSNVAAALYNQGVNQVALAADSSARRSAACPWFSEAARLDSADYDINVALAWCSYTPPPELNIPEVLYGRVTDNRGDPLPDARISGGGLNVRSNSQGRFSLQLKKNGYRLTSIRLTCQKEGYETSAALVSLTDFRGMVNIQLTISQRPVITRTVSGTVTDPAGTPLSGAMATSDYGNARTDAQGSFRISFSPEQNFAGQLRISVSLTGRQTVTQSVSASESLTEVAFVLEPEPVNQPPVVTGTPDVTVTVPAEVSPAASAGRISLPATVRVEGGTFTMGCKDGRDKDCYDWEKPAHTVQVRTFEISKYEITNEEYAAFLNVKGNREEG
ncbi:MAG: SUMF1/EgtB/PvdO family nonheme iron enzyme, partial [Bacteroidota bacterium]